RPAPTPPSRCGRTPPAGPGPPARRAGGRARGSAPRSGAAYRTWVGHPGRGSERIRATHRGLMRPSGVARGDGAGIGLERPSGAPLAFGRQGLAVVLALEALDAACRVDEALLARVERMALGADL